MSNNLDTHRLGRSKSGEKLYQCACQVSAAFSLGCIPELQNNNSHGNGFIHAVPDVESSSWTHYTGLPANIR